MDPERRIETPAQRRGKYRVTIGMYQSEMNTILMNIRRRRNQTPSKWQMERIAKLKEMITAKKQMMELEDEMAENE